MIAEHLCIIRLSGHCMSQGSIREAEPAGNIYYNIYCKELAYAKVGAVQASLKSVGQDVRTAGWKCGAKAAIHRLTFFLSGEPQFHS